MNVAALLEKNCRERIIESLRFLFVFVPVNFLQQRGLQIDATKLFVVGAALAFPWSLFASKNGFTCIGIRRPQFDTLSTSFAAVFVLALYFAASNEVHSPL